MVKIYVTKTALTDGIIEYNDAEIYDNGLSIAGEDKWLCFEDKDWHLTKKAAIVRAEEIRIKKLQALDAQMKKISAIVFD